VKEELIKNMDDLINFCWKNDLEKITLAIPESISEKQINDLLKHKEIAALILSSETQLEGSEIPQSQLGWYNPTMSNWELPDITTKTVAVFGTRTQVGTFMMIRAYKLGFRKTVYASNSLFMSWVSERISLFILKRIIEKIISIISRLLNKLSYSLSLTTKNILNLLPLKVQPYVYKFHFNLLEHLHLRRFVKTFSTGIFTRSCFIPGRVILANCALAPGGAERQLVNTIRGLHEHGMHDISLLCETLHCSDEHQFFLPHLEEIPVEHLKRFPNFKETGLEQEQINQITQAVELLPDRIQKEVIQYAIEFLIKRPFVVHAWQDMTSICAGLAAIMVGVPRIVLSGRNMPPYNFAYYHGFMDIAYRALAQSDRVIMVNNSEAGAEDYRLWLGLEKNQIRVIRNGLAEDFIQRVDKKEVDNYRARLGIPLEAPLVGGIFRFYKEKDPLLWMKTAAHIHNQRPDVWFLIVGAGPMETAIRDFAKNSGFYKQLCLPGIDKQPAVPLSAMDVFLLTSKFEGTPNVLIEAQWIGVPVVATVAGGTAETVEDGVTGWIIQNRNPETIAEKVLSILQDEHWKTQAIKRGIQFSHKRFGLERMIQETKEVYGDFC